MRSPSEYELTVAGARVLNGGCLVLDKRKDSRNDGECLHIAETNESNLIAEEKRRYILLAGRTSASARYLRGVGQ